MDKLYAKVSKIAKQDIYRFMKNNNQSSLNYQFNSYFQYYLKKYDIKLLQHHFSSRKIEGLTIINEEGISFSYEKENPIVKQNFTKCHELGHFVLRHSGTVFTEIRDKKNSQLEREANIFSAIILMPDIVLLSKIFYRQDSFQKVKKDLSVSCEALFYRLVNMFLNLFFKEKKAIFKVVSDYYQGNNQKILNYFLQTKESIIADYQKVEYDIFEKIDHELNTIGFIASDTYPELLGYKFRENLKARCTHIKTWVEFEFGKTVAYAWRSDRITRKQAKINARTILLLM